MCLHKLVPLKTKYPTFKIPKDEKGYYAWKCFHYINKEYAQPLWFGTRQKVGRWINEKDFRSDKDKDTIHCHSDWYPAGFHLYLKRNLEEGWICKKVRIRKVVAKGFQDGRECVVCKEIFIPKQRQRS